MRRPPLARLVALLAAMLLLFGGIIVRLAFLQVRDQGQFEALGLIQRERTLTLPADRGQILDRDGTPLAITLEARDIYVNPTFVTDPFDEAQRLGCSALGRLGFGRRIHGRLLTRREAHRVPPFIRQRRGRDLPDEA